MRAAALRSASALRSLRSSGRVRSLVVRSSGSARSLVARWCEGAGCTQPTTIGSVFSCLVALEACYSVPLTVCRLMLELGSGMPPGEVARMYFSRCVVYFGMLTIFVMLLEYLDLLALCGDEDDSDLEDSYWYMWYLYEEKEGRAVVVLSSCACLAVFRLFDVMMTRTPETEKLPYTESLMCGYYGLLAWDVLLMIVAARAYQEHLIQTGDDLPFYETEDDMLWVDLNKCSRTVAWDSDEVCCICLCCPTGTEVVSTLPCGHTFHKACIDAWLKQGHFCPMRCPPESKKAESWAPVSDVHVAMRRASLSLRGEVQPAVIGDPIGV